MSANVGIWGREPDVKLFYREIGDRIRIRRRQRNVIQAALGRAVGLSPAVITNMEAGRQRIAAHTLGRIAVALDVPVSDLYPR